MKAIKIITSSVLAVSALTFVACSSKSKTADSAYVPPTTTETATPIAEETTPASDQPAYLGASSSGLGL